MHLYIATQYRVSEIGDNSVASIRVVGSAVGQFAVFRDGGTLAMDPKRRLSDEEALLSTSAGL
ncbi:hypothetical protein E2C01_001829 [Portunus trituberculatus]|uniref:Uncharacterized protein n=1 Tax=Portunus trituberculatus TaxID=210409 RepID=A0A5B7CLE0_PORTR|nr:hypothetical protein [Portunus trituberculatus]